MNRILAIAGLCGLLLGLGLAGMAEAGDLTRCDTSIRGEVQSYVYDAESPALKDSLSLREWLYGDRGAVTCPGLVTLRVLTPELNDTERGPFCLQWDRKAASYIGYAEGPRDAWMTCKKPSRSFCERVNASKAAAGRLTNQAAGYVFASGVQAMQSPSPGAAIFQGPGALIGERLVELGASAVSGVSAPVVLGTVAVTAVAVGGAVYVCSESGAEGAAVDAAPVVEVVPDQAVSGLPLDAPLGDLPADVPQTAPLPAQPEAPKTP